MKLTSHTNNLVTPKKQTGAVLIIGLVLLISLTVVGIGMLGTTTLEQRMAGNMADRNLAFNAAETAARAFTARVRDNPNLEQMAEICQGFSSCYDDEDALSKDWWSTQGKTWWASNAYTLDSQLLKDPIKGVKSQPQLVIEYRNVVITKKTGFNYGKESIFYIAVTSRGTGASDDTEVILQQIITKRH